MSRAATAIFLLALSTAFAPTAPPACPMSASEAKACFEPMVGSTDAVSLAHKGIYKELSIVPAGETWEESF